MVGRSVGQSRWSVLFSLYGLLGLTYDVYTVHYSTVRGLVFLLMRTQLAIVSERKTTLRYLVICFLTLAFRIVFSMAFRVKARKRKNDKIRKILNEKRQPDTIIFEADGRNEEIINKRTAPLLAQ